MSFLKLIKSTVVLVAIGLVISCTPKSRDKSDLTPSQPNEGDESTVETVQCDRTMQEGGFITPDFRLNVSDNEIKIMAYNAENFFDAVHDEDHTDWTYLPKDSPLKELHCKEMGEPSYVEECFKTDWTDVIVGAKVEQLAKVVETQGVTPDILALEEVENAAVVGRLAERLGYKKLVITTGSDSRGINNAVVYKEDKLTFLDYQQVVISKKLDTRNILAVYFKTKTANPEIVAIYVNHWPSKHNPQEQRVLAAEVLKDTVDQDRARFVKSGMELHTIAVGDFNTLMKDRPPNPFGSVLLNTKWRGHLVSVNDAFDALKIEKDSALCSLVQNMPQGTYYFRQEVQSLDYFFVGQSLIDGQGTDVQLDSFRIVAGRFASNLQDQKVVHNDGTTGVRKILTPRRFEFESMAPVAVGASDHFPIVIRLKLN